MTLLIANTKYLIADNIGINGRLAVKKEKILTIGGLFFAITGCVQTGEMMIHEFMNQLPAVTDCGTTEVLLVDPSEGKISQLFNNCSETIVRGSFVFHSDSLSMLGDGWRYLQMAISLYQQGVVELYKAAEIFEVLWLYDQRRPRVNDLLFTMVTKDGEKSVLDSMELIELIATDLKD